MFRPLPVLTLLGAIGAAVMPGLAPQATASAAVSAPVPIYSGLAESIIDVCAQPLSSVVGAGTAVTAASWLWLGTDAQVSASARQPRAVIFSTSSTSSSAARTQARAMARCMDAHPLDWSLSLSDSIAQRRILYPYYRDVLDPCLARHTSARPSLPTRTVFLDGGLTRFDPYRFVRVYSADAARRLQAACPPAPRATILEASLIAAAVQR